MNDKLIALKLVLNELHVDPDISTLDDRKRVQKAVYLGQRTGIELGYRFGWYLLGPYSSPLAHDYYELSSTLSGGTDPASGRELRPEAKSRLARLIPIMTPPSSFVFGSEDWLELLASLDYLRTVSGLTREGAVAALGQSSGKQRFVPYAQLAEAKLQEAGLLQ